MGESTDNFQPTHSMLKIAEAMELKSVDGLQEKYEQGKNQFFQKCLFCNNSKQEDKDTNINICTCCDKLRSTLLVPVETSASNLDALITELCGKDSDVTFADIKDQFLEDNYPNIHKGMHTHPDIFISGQKTHGFPRAGKETSDEKGSLSELKVFDFLKEQLKDEDCFIFHTFVTGLDKKVVEQLCNQQTEKLELDENSVLEVEKKMITIANLAFLDWNTIEKEAKKETEVRRCGEDKVILCKTKLKKFKDHLMHKINHEKDFVIVSRSLRAIIHIEVKTSSPDVKKAKTQIFQMKRFLQELQLPDMRGEWSLMGLIAIPEVTRAEAELKYFSKSQNNCFQCKKHVLLKEDFERGGFYETVKQLIMEESTFAGENYPNKLKAKTKRKSASKRLSQLIAKEEKERQVLEQTRNEINYIELISNIVVLSNMDLLPHSHAVGNVMEQLHGTKKMVVSPKDALDTNHIGLCSYKNVMRHNVMTWSRDQMNYKTLPPAKAIITGDFGCGKSVVIHTSLLESSKKQQNGPNKRIRPTHFLLSFLQDIKNPLHVRSILDLSNRAMYEKENIEVIDTRDILHPDSKLQDSTKFI